MCVSSTDPPHYQKRDNIDEPLSTMLTATAKHGHGMLLNTVMRRWNRPYTQLNTYLTSWDIVGGPPEPHRTHGLPHTEWNDHGEGGWDQHERG